MMAKAFLITPFTPERSGNEDPEGFSAVQKAVIDGAKAAEVELMHPAKMNAAGVIMDQVQEAIDKADVVMAILTGQNPNVFYEMGIAFERALRPTILIVRSTEDVPFDVRHQRILTYGGSRELQHLARSVENAIRDTLAQNPRKWRYPQPPLYLNLLELTRETRFVYGARAAPFIGRDSEIEELEAFLQSDASFQWWLLLGPGGQGKSRLALELCLNQRESWYAGFLRDDKFDWLTWKPDKPTLIVADYAVMWFNLNGHRAKSNQQESEVSREPKKKPTKVYPRV